MDTVAQGERRAWASDGQNCRCCSRSPDDDQVDWRLIRRVRSEEQRGLESENPSLMVLPLVKGLVLGLVLVLVLVLGQQIFDVSIK
jgi:hypothetical protein